MGGLPETKVLGDDQDNDSGKKTAEGQATKNGETKSEPTLSKPSKNNELRAADGHQHVDSQSADKPAIQRKKSVSFAEGTKKEDATTSKRHSLPLRPRRENSNYNLHDLMLRFSARKRSRSSEFKSGCFFSKIDSAYVLCHRSWIRSKRQPESTKGRALFGSCAYGGIFRRCSATLADDSIQHERCWLSSSGDRS